MHELVRFSNGLHALGKRIERYRIVVRRRGLLIDQVSDVDVSQLVSHAGRGPTEATEPTVGASPDAFDESALGMFPAIAPIRHLPEFAGLPLIRQLLHSWTSLL
jgi:hypothetical protein